MGENALALLIRLVGIVVGDGELRDNIGVWPPFAPVDFRASQRNRIGDVKLAVLAVIRVKGDAEQPPLIVGWIQRWEFCGKVEKRLYPQAPVRINDANFSVLLDDGLAARSVGDRHHRERMRETACKLHQLDFHLAYRWGGV